MKKITNICQRSFTQFKSLIKNIADTIENFGSNKIFTNSLKKIEDIQKTKIKELLTKIILNGEEYTIISGIYILTDSKSIISDNNIIDGMLFDTTWKILPNYDISIIMGSSMNTGIPLSFAFGEGEANEPFDLHFKNFKSLFNIVLSKFNFECG